MITDQIASQQGIDLRLQQLKQLGELPIVLYGAGLHAAEIQSYFKSLGMEIAGCFVDDAYVGGRHRVQCEVETFDKVAQRLGMFNVVVAQCNDPRQVTQRLAQLRACGTQGPFFIDCRFWEEFQPLTRAYVEANAQQFTRVYELLADEQSRETFVEFLNAKLLHAPGALLKLWSRHQYFPDDLDMFRPSPQDVFVDGGAFTGDTLADFVASTGGEGCRRYYAFEADPANAEGLRRYVREKCLEFVKVMPCGLWSGPATLSFSDGGGTSSVIDQHGLSKAEVDCIDNFDMSPTFIKMDIEGAEAEALRGARETIQRHQPKLAICLYHKLAHLTEIPLLVSELNSCYKIFLRLHRPYTEELVLYAVKSDPAQVGAGNAS